MFTYTIYFDMFYCFQYIFSFMVYALFKYRKNINIIIYMRGKDYVIKN